MAQVTPREYLLDRLRIAGREPSSPKQLVLEAMSACKASRLDVRVALVELIEEGTVVVGTKSWKIRLKEHK
jgi:hypothetical protein